MSKNIKTTLTVAIPTYNEEKNIGNVLNSLLLQKLKRIDLEKIVVYTDGSTDKTPEIVKRAMEQSPKIFLVVGKNQRGKFYRLNKIYKDNTSDILIVLDADIGLNGDMFLENFAASIISDPKAQLVSAHELPLIPNNFIGRVIASSYLMWDQIRWSIPNCDHVQNLYARATAYRGSFAKTLHIPEKATEERLYLYLMAKKTDGFRYCHDTSIFYWPVNTIYDYLKLAERAFGRPQPAVNKIFGFDATYFYTIPKKYKLIGTAKSLYRDPFFTPFALFLGYFLSKMTLGRKTLDLPIWEISLSSKKSIRL